MFDWDHDGDEDYWDDVYYHENIEREYYDTNDDVDLDDDIDIEGYSGGYSSNVGHSSASSNSTNNYRYTTPVRQSTGVPFIVRLIIVAVIASIIGAFNELLGTIVVIIWGIIEFYTR